MLDKLNAFEKNNTWIWCIYPKNELCGHNFPFIVKANPDGFVARLKARIVAKGYAQTYGVNYSDTFSRIAKLTFVHFFISLPALVNFPSHQLNINKAFLHGDL